MTEETTTMTLDDLRRRLRRAQMAAGGARFSATFHESGRGACSILRWSGSGGGDECREIGHGTVAECLAALDRYVESCHRTPSAAG